MKNPRITEVGARCRNRIWPRIDVGGFCEGTNHKVVNWRQAPANVEESYQVLTV
jgi:hypothetical protein